MTTSRTRLLAATSAVPLLALVIARLAWGGDLPPVVAGHWSGSRPDAFADTTTYFWIALAVCAIAAGTAGVVAARIRTDAALWLPATVDGAAQGAALLNSLAAPRPAGQGSGEMP
ncbi:hypothetical protein ACWEK5_09305 [Rhodococcus koreensis]